MSKFLHNNADDNRAINNTSKFSAKTAKLNIDLSLCFSNMYYCLIS